MEKILNLGSHYVSDFVNEDVNSSRTKYSLDLYLDSEIGAARLKEVAPAETMWGKYWYRSGINQSMTLELKGIAEQVSSRMKVKSGDVWLDIACNDGTMFKFMPDGVTKVGIDPCDDSYVAESSKVADHIVQDYFSYSAWQTTGVENKCKAITTIAMFYDLENPHPFIEDIKKVLDVNGAWVIQLSYTPLMIEQLAFDNVCHEHVYYYSLTSLKTLFEQHDLKIVDAELNDTNGGSIRVYIQHNQASIDSFGTAPLRDVCNFRVKALLEYEKNHYDFNNVELWNDYQKRVESLRDDVVSFIRSETAKGKKVYGYGASTKGNTLLQYFGLDNKDIVAIAERSPYKFGLQTIGTNIPIISEDEMRAAKPDYLLVLPWCFISEFRQREKEFFANGGAFIVPCPKFETFRD
jgi:NDP-4-keto-2,6-dideoxyhexose 3-C-methyltransferase